MPPARTGGTRKVATLVVVESPAKCRTIQRYLGRQYLVRASLGHVRDLPAGGAGRGRRRRGSGLGLDPGNGWEASWEVPADKQEVLRGLRRLAGRRGAVVLATDRDREGEAIAWHLRELLGGPAGRFVRVTFNEITEPAIREAFRAPRRLDMALVQAQLARRFLDRLVGWRVSPALLRALGGARSAGRVQSVALRLVVERERAIAAFRPQPYWELTVSAADEGGSVSLAVAAPLDGSSSSAEAHRFTAEAEARAAAEAIRAAGSVRVAAVRSVESVRRPYPPFTTSSLQQAASARLKLPVRRTMELAQRLYEAGAITYMRTDAVSLADAAVQAIRARVRETHGAEYVADPPNVFKAGRDAQEAHEAIRPTVLDAGGGRSFEGDEARLYELIERRALQSQMSSARIRRDTVEAAAAGWRLVLAGVVVLFPGFEAVWPPAERDGVPVPPLDEGSELAVQDVAVIPKRTKAPKRHTQATLVQELEKCGIGRPSTYAQTIDVLLDRGYVESRRRDLAGTPLGDRAVAWLMRHFPDLLDYSFTAALERQLDDIAAGGRDWKQVLTDFDRGLLGQVERASV